MAEIGTLETQVRIKVKMSLLSAIKWRLLGFHKREITSQSAGQITNIEIKMVQAPTYLKLKGKRAWRKYGKPLPEFATGGYVTERECPSIPVPKNRISIIPEEEIK